MLKEMNRITVKLSYKASGLQWIDSDDLTNLHKELKENYISNISPNGGPQAGGVVDTIVELIFDISFIDFLNILKEGLIFDVVFRREKSYILKPLFNSFAKVEANNECWDYTEVRFLFNGTEMIVYGTSQMFTSKLGAVLNLLSKHYNNLDIPTQILIPMIREVDVSGNELFMNHGEGRDYYLDEYSKFWGISYDFGNVKKIYDLENSKIIDGSNIYF
jgi:hypothetical protein